MKIFNFVIAAVAALWLSGCTAVPSDSGKAKDFFPLPDGRMAKVYQLRCADGFGVDISDFGAAIIALYTPDREGKVRNVALSWRDPARYLKHPIYLGAVAGPLTNRVKNGRFTLDGKVFQLLKNERKTHTLHGGLGVSGSLWQVKSHTRKQLVLTLKRKDGEGGFPGNLDITATYSIKDDHTLDLQITAVPDRKTVADFTSHVYLNLNGEGNGDCSDHRIMINAARRTEVDKALLPTGKTPLVAGTAYDLLAFRSFADIRKSFPNGLDDNYIHSFRAGAFQPAAVVWAKESGIRLTFSSNRPGIQFYMGGCLQNKVGRSAVYVKGGGFCLEAQGWPDAVNHPKFPPVVVTPKRPYRGRFQWKFDTVAKNFSNKKGDGKMDGANKFSLKKNFDVAVTPPAGKVYHGWPTVANMGNGELVAVCSGNRESHVCPFGRVTLFRSRDNGRSWSAGEKITNGPLDDRDAGIVLAADGSWLVNYFTSVHGISTRGRSGLPASWQAEAEKITLADIIREHGLFMLRSTDRGKSWSRSFVPINNVHGPALLKDGSLLWAGKDLDAHAVKASCLGNKAIICRSTDNGITWEKISELPQVPGQSQQNWHEIHQIECADGTIVVQFRNHSATPSETWQTESADQGKTWTMPRKICVGIPSHLVKLPDGKLLMCYSFRQAPYGNRARVSCDNGKSWSEELIISNDGQSWDLGYPSTAICDDGTLFTLWYENIDGVARLRGVNWNLLEK